MKAAPFAVLFAQRFGAAFLAADPRIFLLLAVVVLSSVAGELLVTHAMKQLGEINDFRPAPFLRSIGRAVCTGWFPAGIAMMAISFFTFMAVLSSKDVSFVVPVTAITYVLNTLGASLFLGERVSARRWLGAVFVTAGVALVSL